MAKSMHNVEHSSKVDSSQTTINEDEEEKHFRKIVGAFLYYR